MTNQCRIDEYLNDRTDSPHLSPKLIIEKSVLPSLTLWVGIAGSEAKLQRWYDVTQETLNGIGIKSLDFWPDSTVRLTDKNGRDIHKLNIKLTEELDGLPLVLARIEKAWSDSQTPNEFWNAVCAIMLRTRIPEFQQALPDYFVPIRTTWLELACFWTAYLAEIRCVEDGSAWNDLTSGSSLVLRYVEFYNQCPTRGPQIDGPKCDLNRDQLHGMLTAVKTAANNQSKKQSLETLAGCLLGSIKDFEVLGNKITATGELDRFVRNNSTYPAFSLLGSPILVECKHWKKTVGTDPIGSFMADLQDARVSSGFLFARDPVSAPAKKRIENFYQRQRGYIIVITESDIERLCEGGDLVRLIIEKTEAIVCQKS